MSENPGGDPHFCCMGGVLFEIYLKQNITTHLTSKVEICNEEKKVAASAASAKSAQTINSDEILNP